MLDAFADRYVYFLVLALLVIGLYGMLAKRNLVKKLIGMNIFETGIFLFFIEGAVKLNATVPVIDPHIGTAPERYMNPLPHAMIVTAIVVALAVTGVALAFMLTIYRAYGSLDEAVILEKLST